MTVETFALFAHEAGGAAVRIILGFYEADSFSSNNHPLSSKPINIEDQEIRDSANNGFHSAFHALHKQGLIAPNEKYCFTYQFEAQPVSFFGKSAGLAFCLKFVQEVYLAGQDRIRSFNIAATGELSDATENSRVKRVEGISSKIAAALLILQPGDKFFYPLDNTDEIDSRLRQNALEKGVDLVPCDNVSQAIKRLIELAKPEPCPDQPYPIELSGLEVVGSGPGTYQVFKKAWIHRQWIFPFSIINHGDLTVKMTSTTNRSGSRQFGLASSECLVPPRQSIRNHIAIPKAGSLLFLLKFFLTPFFMKQEKITLQFHIPEQTPYTLTRDIAIKIRFVNLPLGALFGMVVMAWFFGWLLPGAPPAPGIHSPQIAEVDLADMITDLEHGKYLEVRDTLGEHLERFPKDPAAARLYQQLNQAMDIKINFIYTGSEQTNVDVDFTGTRDGPHELVLKSGDGYRFEVMSDSDFYLYIFQKDASDKIELLFPRSDFASLKNPLQAHTTYLLPPDGLMFWLDDTLGMETLYFIASIWRAADLEDLIREYAQNSEYMISGRLQNDLLKHLELRRNGFLKQVGGCFYKEFSFQHQ